VERLQNVQAEQLPENSVLLSNSLGSQSRWVVILYFNVGTSQ
jgi:hypothetical protein